jgi:hypothetical protein
MNPDDASEFDDPALKSALRRAFAGHGAPAHLRGRIELALAGAGPTLVPGQDSGGWRGSWERWRDTIYASIAAAVLALGIGVVVLQYRGAFDAGLPAYAGSIDADLPPGLAGAVIEQHHRGLALGMPSSVAVATVVSTSTSPATKDLTTLSNQLSSRLGFPVLAADPGPEWALSGAGICQVGPVKAAHLLFTRGDDAVSIFSLPAAGGLQQAPDNARFAAMVRGQPIVAFKRGLGMYVTVGYSAEGRVMLSDVLLVRNLLQGNDPYGGCSTTIPAP